MTQAAAMLDHVGIGVSLLQRSRLFYEAVLGSLGYGVVQSSPTSLGFGAGTKPEFTIFETEAALVLVSQHIAFAASSRASVDAFYAAARATGAACNGAPGLRPEYHANYYGAFVLDPDGNNIEAVCHVAR